MCLAIPGKIVEMMSSGDQESAMVEVVGVRRKIDVGLLSEDKLVPGDWVLIHVGFAMSKISEADAADQMNTLRMLGEVAGAMQEVQGYGLDGNTDGNRDDGPAEYTPPPITKAIQ
jgi:hydrogenase expression/formation protein HypC